MRFQIERFFDLDGCVGCGRCLIECPVFNFSGEKARAEKKKLLAGENSVVLEQCKSCCSCDRFCPNDCRPYSLILYRWFERYKAEGIPARARFSLPAEEHNFLESAVKDYTREEKALTARWRRNADSNLEGQDVIFAGCNAQIFPYLLSTPLLAGVKVLGEPGLCCGEVYYRMGLFDRVKRLALSLQERLGMIKPRRLIMFCPAGYNMQKNILPRQFGVKLDCEHIYIGEWLLEKVRSGKIRFDRPIGKKIVVQESCHAKVLGDDFMNKPRELLEAAGAEIVEMKPKREQQICCGVADGIARFNPLDMMVGGSRQWKQAQASGADVFAPYCGTCYLMLKMVQKRYFSSIECLHLLELLDSAAGGTMKSIASRRATKVLTGALLWSPRGILSRNRLFPEE